MKDNPWSKRHPGRRKVSIRMPDRVLKDLVEAGWKPSMVGLPVTDSKIHALLLELCDANSRRTRSRMRAS